jgi:hypothetical protein
VFAFSKGSTIRCVLFDWSCTGDENIHESPRALLPVRAGGYVRHADQSAKEIQPHRNDLHPTMKPVALVERAIENSSRAGEVVAGPVRGVASSRCSFLLAPKCGYIRSRRLPRARGVNRRRSRP